MNNKSVLITGASRGIGRAAAQAFAAPDWFGEEVTFSKEYHNSYMSRFGIRPHAQP